jgi:hypothetical protein
MEALAMRIDLFAVAMEGGPEPLPGEDLPGEPDHPAEVAELPPLTDAEAKALVRRLAVLHDAERSLMANYRQMKRDLEAERDHLLACEETRLRAWAATQYKRGARSRTLLEGVIGLREVPLAATVLRQEAAVEWAYAHCPQAIEEVVDLKYLDLAQFRAVDPETGEVRYEAPEWLQIRPARDVFYVHARPRSKSKPAEGGDDQDDE